MGSNNRMKQFLDSDMYITVLDSIGDGFGDMLLIEIEVINLN